MTSKWSHEFLPGSPGQEQHCGYPGCGRGAGASDVHGPASQSAQRIRDAALRADLSKQRAALEAVGRKFPGLVQDVPELSEAFGLNLVMAARMDGELPPPYLLTGGKLPKRPRPGEQTAIDLPAAS